MSGESVGAIYYTVEADTSKLLDSIQPTDKSLDGLNKTFSKTDKAANDVRFQMTKTAAAVKGLGTESASARTSLSGLYGALAGLVSLRAAQGLIDMADAYNEMAERIAMATDSQEEYEHVQQRLLKTANGTYRSLSEAQDLYVLTSKTLKGLGYDTDQAMDIVDSMSYSFVKNATSVDRANGTISAFTKSVNKGRVEADAWESILAAIPTIVQDLAASTGLATTEILRLGASGKLTGQQLTEALRGALDENKKAADGMATTVKDAYRNLTNNLSVFVGEANRAHSATQLMSSALIALGNNIETVVKLLMVAGSGALARYIAQLGASAIASGRAMLAARAQAAEELRLAQAHMAATQRALAQAAALNGLSTAHGRAAAAATAHAAAVTRAQAAQQAMAGVAGTLLRVLGGPVGVIALAASAGAAFVGMGRDASGAAPDINMLADSIDKLSKAQLELRQQQAGDIADRLRSEMIDASKAVRGLERDISDLDKMAGQGRGVDAVGMSNARKSLVEARAELDGLRGQLDSVVVLEQRLADEQQKRRNASAGSSPSQQSDPEVEKRLSALRDELALAKLTGEARARLQAIQKLGANATAEERAEAERLAAEIYRLETAQKAVKTGTKESAAAAKENAKALGELAQNLVEAGLAGEDLAAAKAANSLNKFASPQEIAAARELGKELYKAAEGRKLLTQFDPMAGQMSRYKEELDAYKWLLENKALEDSRYQELRTAAERSHQEAMFAIQEENFRAQSDWNNFLMTGIDALGQGATNVLSGLLTGTVEAADAARALSGVIANEVIGQFVRLGIEQVKAWVMGRAAAAVAGAAYAAGVAGQVQANTALAAQATFASISAIPIVGPFMAPAMAAQAAVTAGALGAPAIPAAAVSAGRLYGGPVAADGMYRINETGKPEILNMANGQQFLLPNQRGEVVSNRDATRASTREAASARPANAGVLQVTLNGSWFSAADVRRLIGDLNDAVQDGMIIRTKS